MAAEFELGFLLFGLLGYQHKRAGEKHNKQFHTAKDVICENLALTKLADYAIDVRTAWI